MLNKSGQGTVEVLIVTMIVLIIAIGLMSIVNIITDGYLLELAMKSAPYNLGSSSGLVDYAILF